MKVGDIGDVVAQLRHDVCMNGRVAYVLTCGCEFDEVIRHLAADVECGQNVFWWIETRQIPQENIEIFEIAIARKIKELQQRIFRATAENWCEHRDALYVVCGEGPSKNALIKAGDYQAVKSMLLQNVCIEGREAYVVTSKPVFDYLLRDMAADCASAEYSLWHYERGLIPKRCLAEFCMNMSHDHKTISEHVKLVDESQTAEHGGEVYVLARDMQLAISTFAEMVDEQGGDLAAAVERFNDCYNAKSFFGNSKDRPEYRNVERLEQALAHPICLVGNREDGTNPPRLAALQLALEYLSDVNDDALKNSFFRRAMKENDPRFRLAKAQLYWHFHEFADLGDAIKRFPSPKACGLSKRLFREMWLEFSGKRARYDRKGCEMSKGKKK